MVGAPAVSHHGLWCTWVISGNLQAQSGLTPEPGPGAECAVPSFQAWLAEAESRVLSNRGDTLGRHTRPPDPPASAPPDSSSNSNNGSQENKERCAGRPGWVCPQTPDPGKGCLFSLLCLLQPALKSPPLRRVRTPPSTRSLMRNLRRSPPPPSVTVWPSTTLKVWTVWVVHR